MFTYYATCSRFSSRRLATATVVVTFLVAPLTRTADSASVPPAQRCAAAKNKAAGKRAACLAGEEGKALLGTDSDPLRCEAAFARAFAKAETVAVSGGGACPVTGDAAEIATRVANAHAEVAAALLGTPLPECGDAARNGGEQCDGTDLGGTTCADLGYLTGGSLGCSPGCSFDTSSCRSAQFPATGQTVCWNTLADEIIPCAGTGLDGESHAGGVLSFVDNGDGTLTDLNTGLMWEKKSDDGSIHDKDQIFWSLQAIESDRDFRRTLNHTCDQAAVLPTATTACSSDADCVGVGTGRCGFAGHQDWRVPNIKELQSIAAYDRSYPALPEAFLTDCSPGCTVLECSCLGAAYNGFLWSSSRNAADLLNFRAPLWAMSLDIGSITAPFGSNFHAVAVRTP